MNTGDKAPPFELRDQNGTAVTLASLHADGPAVVFFYPKDGTPVCTAEACAFRDAYETFTAAGAKVVGISSDDAERHAQFAAKYHLPFPLLWDEGGKTRAAWGVPKTLGVLPGRATYVVDRAGVVRHVFVSQLDSQRHVDEALGVVKTLAGAGG